jgi:hypothetical protein
VIRQKDQNHAKYLVLKKGKLNETKSTMFFFRGLAFESVTFLFIVFKILWISKSKIHETNKLFGSSTRNRPHYFTLDFSFEVK